MADPHAPASGAEFTPEQLDQLEDALEGLESAEFGGLGTPDLPDVPDLPDLPDMGPALRARLGEYRDLLDMSRAAFPLEEPDPNLLAGVIAQARQSVASAPEPPAGAATRAQPRRRTWLPWVALAASAAAVLFWVRPGEAPSDAPALADAGAAVDTAKAKADRAAQSPSPKAAGAAQADADVEPSPTAEEETPPDELQEAKALQPSTAGEPTPLSPASTKKSARPAKPADKAVSKAAAGPEAKDLPGTVLDKEQAWDALTRAHGQRRGGDCGAATRAYTRLLDPSLPANLRAQARGGLGLCADYRGDAGAADEHYAQARQTLDGIDGWIAAEREEMRAVGKPPKRRAKRKKAAAKAAPVDAAEMD